MNIATNAPAGAAPRLVFRFAVYTGLVLLIAGAAIFWLVQRGLTTRAEEALQARAHRFTEASLSRQLRASDFRRAVGAERRRKLDDVFGRELEPDGVLQAKLINRRGTITFSTDHATIGGRIDHPDALADALAGQSHRHVRTFHDGERTYKVIESVIPVRLTANGRPLGAVELYQDYRPVGLEVEASTRRLALILVIALLALYASLFPILRRATAELKARNRRLSEQAVDLSKLATIVESSDDAIIATDLNGVVVSWNKGAELLFGFPAHEMHGRSMSVVSPPDRRHEFGEHIRMLADGNRLTHVETVRLRRDGTRVDVSLTLSPLRGDDGAPVGFAGIVREITQQKRLETQREGLLLKERLARAEAETAQTLLTEQNERLRELDRLKDEFVSLVSHELRTPLTSISGYLELLLDGEAGELTEEQRRLLRIVDRNSGRLLHLVGDLLFLAQVDSGKLTVDLAEVELDGLVAECVEAAQPVAADKRVQLTSDVTPVPVTVGDRSRLAQLLDNLISNAIKFTPEGGRVELRLVPENGNAVLEIADTGIGIPLEEQDKLFERFFRSSTATEHAIQGTGLGLSIARAIVERHDGTIGLDSAPGTGTTVRVSIPLRSPSSASLGVEKVPA